MTLRLRVFLIAIATLGISVLSAAATAQTASTESGSSAFLDDARKYVIETSTDRAVLKLNEKSILNWTNPTRQQERGAIHIWTHNQRPLAIGSFFTYSYKEKVYLKHELHSLSTGPLKSTFDGKLAWTPNQAGIEWDDFVDGPQPKESHNNRLLQMRQLSRPFSSRTD